MLIEFDGYDWLIGVVILVALLPVLWRRKHTLSYLFFFAIFWVYLLAVVQFVIFPFAIHTDSSGSTFTPSINLLPFYFGNCFQMPGLCIKSILENVILTIPFGFGINFLCRIKPKNIFWVALAVGLVLEFSQLVISLAFRSAFRAVDINDALLNATGVWLGYALFRAFALAYLKVRGRFGFLHIGLFAAIDDVVVQMQSANREKK